MIETTNYEALGRWSEAVDKFEEAKKQREGFALKITRLLKPIVDFSGAVYGACGSRTEINRGKNKKVNNCNVCGAGYESSIVNLIIDFSSRLIDCDRDNPRSKVYFVQNEE